MLVLLQRLRLQRGGYPTPANATAAGRTAAAGARAAICAVLLLQRLAGPHKQGGGEDHQLGYQGLFVMQQPRCYMELSRGCQASCCLLRAAVGNPSARRGWGVMAAGLRLAAGRCGPLLRAAADADAAAGTRLLLPCLQGTPQERLPDLAEQSLARLLCLLQQ